MENLRKDIKNTVYALLIAGMVGGVSACGSKDTSTTKTSSSTSAGSEYESGSDAEIADMDESSWMKERDTYVSTHRATLDKIDRDIEAREKGMESMNGKTKSAMNESIKSLKMKRDQFKDKLNEMEQSTEENWTRMRSEIDESAVELDRTHEAFSKQYGMDQ